MRTLSILLLSFSLAAVASAQSKGGDVALTYTAERANLLGGCGCFWLQGGGIEAGVNVSHGFGLATNMTVVHASHMGPQNVSLGLLTFTVGPRYRLQLPAIGKHGDSLTGKWLIGLGRGFDSVFPGNGNALSSSTSFAMDAGVQYDVDITNHFAIRPLEVDWERSTFPNTNANGSQNTLRLAFGALVRFGRR